MNKVSNFIAFAAGAVIGSAATWYLLKEKFEKQYQEDVRSVKKRLLGDEHIETESPVEEKKDIVEPTLDKSDLNEAKEAYKDIVAKYDYTQFTQNKEEVLSEPEEVDEMNEPYIITPEQFEDSEYEIVSLTYYADGVIADTITDEILEDPEDIVGEFRSHFGEYEEDSVYVRNDNEFTDYEILSDDRKYSDVIGQKYSNVANEE